MEMLKVGTICPSQTPWCNVVWKKGRSLYFCTDFYQLNEHMKKDLYPLPHIQEVMESLVGAGHFSCLYIKSGFWQAKMDEESNQ